MSDFVTIHEVGLRDGLQNQPVPSKTLNVVQPPDWPTFRQDNSHVANALDAVRPTTVPPAGNDRTVSGSSF